MTQTFTLRPVPPYDFDLTASYITHFRGRYGADVYEGGAFRRLFDVNGQVVLASATSDGTIDEPLLRVELRGGALDEAGLAEAKRLAGLALGVEDDLAPFYRMAKDDGVHLGGLVRAGYGLHVPITESVYKELVLSILGQQISYQVARVLRTGIIEAYGESVELDSVTYYLFPRPDAIVDAGIEGLRAIKFSQRKAEYIHDISSRVASGELGLEGLRRASAEEVVRTLTKIRGVGEWTANWLMVHATGHSDGFPYGDLALQRNLGRLVNGGSPMTAAEALEYSKRWSPYRTYVTTYLFAMTRSGRFDALVENITGQVIT
jgi:DNA-3-methyladenine glycosylase II